jgi:acyl-coenzyme A synthetase/AMP-(fatty) acid ligase
MVHGGTVDTMSLTRLAQESLDKYGEYVALAFEGRQYTNVEQDRAACRLANVLKRLGVGPGDRVTLMGEEVVAFVVLKDGQTATSEEVIAVCQSRLAKFKCPRQVRFVRSLPKSPIGKILRKELRGQA